MNNNLPIDDFCAIQNVDVYNDYSCTLSQKDLYSKRTKFYRMQLLKLSAEIDEQNNKCVFFHYIRYGRVGEVGKTLIKSFSSSEMDLAITTFIKQFKTKTGNSWNDRQNFDEKYGLYSLSGI